MYTSLTVTDDRWETEMTYKRIIQITDEALAEAMADEAAGFGVTFRKARTGGADEYVIEGTDAQKRSVDNMVDAIAEMDAQATAAALVS
jgi:hypothetical protein